MKTEKSKKKKRRAYISTFEYEVTLEYHPSSGGIAKKGKSKGKRKNKKFYRFISPMVTYILIEHDYRKRVMPVIYLKVKILPSVYNKMVPDQGKGKLYLSLYRKQIESSTSSIYKNVIRDEFDYYMTDDPNTFKELETTGEESGESFRICTIGLIKTELQTLNKKVFQGVYKNTNIASLVQEATKHMGDVVIQPFLFNTPITEFTCPAVPSVGQFLHYLNSQYSFYNGSYIFYMDLDKTYIRSNDGSYIDIKDGDNKYIAIDVRDLTNHQSFAVGQLNDKSQKAYIIYVSGSDAQILTDRETSELIGQVQTVNNSQIADPNLANLTAMSNNLGTVTNAVGVTTTTNADGTTSTTDNSLPTITTTTNVVDTSAITNIDSKLDSTILVSSVDPNAASVMSATIAESACTLEITKSDMDSRIFTPNKQYLLCNYNDNQAYCGVYYLVKKQEIYLRTGAQMNCQMVITLRKAADFIESHPISSTATGATTNSSSGPTGGLTPGLV